jgi:hypothetical protein
MPKKESTVPKIPPRKAPKKAGTPFYVSTPFVLSVSVIALSMILMLEPVAILVDEFLGTSTSAKSQRALAYKSKGSMNVAADQLCATRPGTCSPAPSDPTTSFQVTLINKSKYRADVHWDDGATGKVIADIEGNGSSMSLSVFPGNQFFLTRHGVKEGLFDPDMNVQLKFAPLLAGSTFIIPEAAAPSSNPCQDRFEICRDYAAKGLCWSTPGWMIGKMAVPMLIRDEKGNLTSFGRFG